MTRTPSDGRRACDVCERTFPASALHPWGTVRAGLSALIARDHPDWGPDHAICTDDLSAYRARYVEELLERERGDLGDLERQVIESMQSGVLLAQNTVAQTEARATLSERAADRVAAFGGSWTFIGSFALILLIWITLNSARLLASPFDPYPFILLNLALSCIAAIQAPVIMMSQRRQETSDRMRAENDYGVNLKAELEIRQLHEKMDHLLARQWETLAEMQRLQIDILEERAREGS